PAPKDFTGLPDRSNLNIGARSEPAQGFRNPLFARAAKNKSSVRSPHLSKTQMLPSRSTSTPDVDPHFLPSGNFAQPSSMRYGLSCAYAIGMIATIAAMRVNIIRYESRITITSLRVTNGRITALRNQPG